MLQRLAVSWGEQSAFFSLCWNKKLGEVSFLLPPFPPTLPLQPFPYLLRDVRLVIYSSKQLQG